MIRIEEVDLPYSDKFELEFPKGAKVVMMGSKFIDPDVRTPDAEKPFMAIMFDTSVEELEKHTYVVFPTNADVEMDEKRLEKKRTYVGSFLARGSFSYHVFEDK